MVFLIKTIFALVLFGLSIMIIVKKVKKLKMYNSYMYDAYNTLSPYEKKKQINTVKIDIIMYILYAIYSITIMISDIDLFVYSALVSMIIYALYIDSRI